MPAKKSRKAKKDSGVSSDAAADAGTSDADPETEDDPDAAP